MQIFSNIFSTNVQILLFFLANLAFLTILTNKKWTGTHQRPVLENKTCATWKTGCTFARVSFSQYLGNEFQRFLGVHVVVVSPVAHIPCNRGGVLLCAT